MPVPRNVHVRALTPSDVPAATRLLTRSHADYPAFRHVWPDPGVRARALLPFTRATVADAARLGGGTIALDGAEVQAVALWLPPGAYPWSPRRKLRATPSLMRTAAADVRAFRRFAAVGAAAERSHPAGPHWYLETLGVDPSVRGRGRGAQVLRPGLERADAEGLPCYVETSDPANESFYRRWGFEVVAPRLEHLDNGPPYLGMLRPAAARPSPAAGDVTRRGT